MTYRKTFKTLIISFFVCCYCIVFAFHTFAESPILTTSDENAVLLDLFKSTGITVEDDNYSNFKIIFCDFTDEINETNWTISGYANETVGVGKTAFIVKTPSEAGLFGSGVGITVDTSCSAGTYDISFAAAPESGKGDAILETWISTNTHWYSTQKMTHYAPAYYAFFFNVPNNVPDFNIQVWIYD